ncbi:hypothetical protein [Lacticaseibacillus porcinae]|uniref:hypothetical protein n=1 Tax=Lacticaseibacillus porcinae TaxID=1123687 RepID=UPI000F7712CB|nr:hypothetical protein [Lacticaseibacillus porcinae]
MNIPKQAVLALAVQHLGVRSAANYLPVMQSSDADTKHMAIAVDVLLVGYPLLSLGTEHPRLFIFTPMQIIIATLPTSNRQVTAGSIDPLSIPAAEIMHFAVTLKHAIVTISFDYQKQHFQGTLDRYYGSDERYVTDNLEHLASVGFYGRMAPLTL